MNKRHFYLFSSVLHVSLQARLYFAHTVFTVYSTGDVLSTTLLLSSFARFYFNKNIFPITISEIERSSYDNGLIPQGGIPLNCGDLSMC